MNVLTVVYVSFHLDGNALWLFSQFLVVKLEDPILLIAELTIGHAHDKHICPTVHTLAVITIISLERRERVKFVSKNVSGKI
jgi:hypothetical protein